MIRLFVLLLMFQWATPDKMVYVRNCSQNKFVLLYSDPSRTLALPNPFLANRDGSYKFYTPNNCVSVEVK